MFSSYLRAYANAFTNFTDFRGRATRSEFWPFVITHFAIMVLLTILFVLVSALAVISDVGHLVTIFAAIVWTYEIGALLPAVAVTVRRLHDTSRSGWWTMFLLVPIVGWALLLLMLLQGTSAYDRSVAADYNPITHPVGAISQGTSAYDRPVAADYNPITQPVGTISRGGVKKEMLYVINIVLIVASLGGVLGGFVPNAEYHWGFGDWGESENLNVFQLGGFLAEATDDNGTETFITIVVAILLLAQSVTLIMALAGIAIGRWPPLLGIGVVLSSLIMFLISIGLALFVIALAADDDIPMSVGPGVFLMALCGLMALVFSIWGAAVLSKQN